MAPRTRLRALAAALALLAVVVTAVAYAGLPQQSGTVDLATQSNVRIDGAAAGNVFGEQSAPAGDFDGDGVDDLVVTNGAATFAWIVFGSASGGDVDLAGNGPRGIRITGANFNSAAGGRDFNGDGLSDVVVGASAGDSAWVILGRGTRANIDIAALGSGGFELSGNAGDSTGASVAMSPDMNADGKAEVVVGAFGADNNARNDSGSAYVVFGTAATSAISLPALGSGGFRIDGAAASHAAGSVVAAGADATGDGTADILVGAPGASFSFASAGAVYVVGGKASTANIDLNAACTCFRIDGQRASDQLPRSLTMTADMNGDGIGEAVVGTDFADNPTAGDGSAGSAWVVFGKASTTGVALATLGSGGFRIDGQKASDQAARSMGAPGDVNGDGKPDVVLGALFADNNGRSNSGSAYVVYGTASTATVSLASLGSAGFRIDGPKADDSLGRSANAAGDFNDDGRPDVVSGAEFADPVSRNAAGSAFVVFGFGPPAFAYPSSTIAATVNLPIAPLTPTGIKRTGGATFTVAPALPAGLALDPATGTISGTPTAVTPDTAHTVTMTDDAGAATAIVNVRVDAVPSGAGPGPGPGSGSTPPPPKPCTTGKTGNARANKLTGTSGSDLIRGRGGNDLIRGLAGNDCLFGEAGNDTIDGGRGNDKLDGGKGRDKLIGGKGKDRFTAGAGNDTILAKDGIAETVNCGKGRDRVKADKKDRLKGCEKKLRQQT